MARESEMQEFTRSFFRGRPDLSTLTHSIVRRRFLAHTGRGHLDPKEKQALKRLVEEELLRMQVDEASVKEGLHLAKKAKRPPTPRSDPQRKRFGLNLESEPSAAASSPDCFSQTAKNGRAAVISLSVEGPKRDSKKAVESSDEEEQQRDLTAKVALEKEEVKESFEEEENSARTSKVWKESSEEEEDEEQESKGRTRKKPVPRDQTQWKGGKRQSGSSEDDREDSRKRLKATTEGMGKSAKMENGKTANGEASDSEREVSDSEAVGTPEGEKNRSYRKSSKKSRTRSSSSSSANGSPEPKGFLPVRMTMRWEATIKNKQAPGKVSASKKQAMEEREDSEEEPAQRTENKGAKRHQENEKESEGEETLAKKEKREKKDWKPTAPQNGGKKSAWEEGSSKQKSRAAKVLGDVGYREVEKEKAAAGSGDNSGGEEEPLVQRKSKDRTQWNGDKRQSGSSEEDKEDSWRKLKAATKGMGKTARVESRQTVNGEASDSEREVSDSEAGGTPKGERKNRPYRKSSKKSRTRSSSSSSANGSPEPKGRKAGHRDEDHPAVMRLKRYIRACGAYRNYKKLLGSCRSRKERLCVLRAELEALGMKEKCRALKEQREEAAEVASLDVTNIISYSGRPRRRTAWNPSEAATPGELYRRTLDSEEEWHRPPRPDWSHMRGIISSDGESN
uniref:HIRA interacting protein 3 n=1 Tax=Molossus molossus TaxID=27622 RepID=A0A7J8IYD1_MOLMO|nr:HIRA interacting protein 3 [Molossus molossus]